MLKIYLLIVVFASFIGSVCFNDSLLAATKEYYGAECNPTGNPIGGGKGYKKIIKKWDFCVSSVDGLVKALAEAKAGQIIYIDDNAEISLTMQLNNVIPAGVTLASGRGYKGSKGALIYSDDMATQSIFKTGGPKVRITGLRLRGPDAERRESAYVAPNSFGISAEHPDFELDNCEVFNWSAAAISLPSLIATAYIHHNFIHHNQRAGLGYGVVLNKAAALIEANIFDWNRHAIAGTGASGTSYEARYNLILEHANGYSFDMHGGRDRKDGTDIGGTSINIHHNTFRMTDYWGVLMNGIPEKEALIHHNWFYHIDTKKAADQYYDLNSHMYVYKNLFGPKKELRGTQIEAKANTSLEWQGKQISALLQGSEMEMIDYKDGKFLVNYKEFENVKSLNGWIDAEQAKIITITKAYCVSIEKKGLIADYSIVDFVGAAYGNPQQLFSDNRSFLIFDGENDYIDLGRAKLPGLDKSGTIIVRFKTEAYKGGILSIATGTGWEDERLILVFNNYYQPPGFIFCMANGKKHNQYSLESFGLPKLGEWTYIALTWDGSSIAYYINGLRKYTFTQYINPEISDSKFWIGQSIGISGPFFQGIIDKIRIYSRPLSDEEILYQFTPPVAKEIRKIEE